MEVSFVGNDKLLWTELYKVIGLEKDLGAAQ